MQIEFFPSSDRAEAEATRSALAAARAAVPFDWQESALADGQRPHSSVVVINGQQVFEGPPDPQVLRRALERERAFAAGVDPLPLPSGRAKAAFIGVALAAVSALAVVELEQKLVIAPAHELQALEVTPMKGPAPTFVLADSQAATHTLADYRGKVVFLNFWASWCAPCREEMPSMARLAFALRNHPDFAMVAVSVDDGWGPIQDFFKQEFGGVAPPFLVLRDPEEKISGSYGTSQFPESYVVDRQGQLVAKFIGARDWTDVAARRYLEKVLAGERPN